MYGSVGTSVLHLVVFRHSTVSTYDFSLSVSRGILPAYTGLSFITLFSSILSVVLLVGLLCGIRSVRILCAI